MSDFLSNLLMRSFAQAPVIRPRLPSLFERAPMTPEVPESADSLTTHNKANRMPAAVTTGDMEDSATLASLIPLAVPTPLRTSVPAEPLSVQRIEAVEQAAESRETDHFSSLDSPPVDGSTVSPQRSTPPPLPRLQTTRAEPTGLPPTAEGVQQTRPPARPTAQDASYSRRPTVPARPRQDAAVVDSAPIDGPTISHERIPPLAVAQPLGLVANEPSLDISESVAVEIPEENALPLRSESLVVPRRAPHAATISPEPPATAAQTVRITIGRVEVRAMAAPAPPISQSPRPAAPRRNPMLSLDDYLKRPGGADR